MYLEKQFNFELLFVFTAPFVLNVSYLQQTESLNVATATAIILGEFKRLL